jgi:integrase
MFRKVRDDVAIVGLTFHDTRHEAITRLARKVDVLDLARITGHKDLRIPRSSGHPFHKHLTTDSTVIRPPIPRVSDH